MASARMIRLREPGADVARGLSRFADELGAAIRRQGFCFEDVERRLGWPAGLISEQLDERGGRDLYFDQVLQVLDVIGLDPPAFFSKVWP